MWQRKYQNVLDNTLRYLYSTRRNGEKVTVAIEFKHGGRTWRADTPEEAIALRKQLELEADDLVKGFDPAWVWTADLVYDLLRGMRPLQSEFIGLLNEKESITSAEVMKELGLGSMNLAGVLSGLSKQLKKMDLKPWDLYRVEVSWAGKDKTRTFRLSDEFKSAAAEIGWPENWKKK